MSLTTDGPVGRVLDKRHRHSYGSDPQTAWRVCACTRSIPAHADRADPAGGPGCGMVWRVCEGCEHIDEHHVTEQHGTEHADDQADDVAGRGDVVHRPGGHLRQDVPAGSALPPHNRHAPDGVRA